MSENKTECKAIVSEMRLSKLFWIQCRRSFIVLTVIALVFAVWLVFNLMSAMHMHSVMIVFYPFIHGAVFVFCAHFIVIYSKFIYGAAKYKRTVSIILYANRFLVVSNDRARGIYSETMYNTVDFTANKEKKNYFFVRAPGISGNVISKRGLSAEQLNAVRRVFGLPVKDGGETPLPDYDENNVVINTINEIRTDTSRRFIKTSFSEYYSRDKKMMRAQTVISSMGTAVSCAALIFTGACYSASDALWAAALVFLSVVALAACAVWLDHVRYDLKQSKNTTLGGTVSENMFFADGMMVYSYDKNSFVVRTIPYDKIARVRETKEDIWIDYPKGYTYVTVKSTLTQSEYQTILKLLKRNVAPNADTIELDKAPDIGFDNR